MGRKAAGVWVWVITLLAGASAASAQEPAAPQGPVAYWKFDEPNLTAGVSSAVGSVPLGAYNGGITVSNTVAPVTYKNDHSLNFNGSTGVVSIPQFSALTQFSISTWIYRTGGAANRQSIVSYKEGAGGGFVLSLNEDGSTEHPRIYSHTTGWMNQEEAFTIPANTWIHLVGTYDATTLILYRDGNPVASGAITGGNMTDPSGVMGIGGRSSLTTWFFQGLIDDVRLYQRALDATEVSVLAAGCPVPTGLTATPPTGPVTLTWSAPPGTTPLGGYKYNVKRGTISGTYPTPVATGIATTSCVDNTISVGNTYYYVVTAVSAAESGNSVEAASMLPITALPNTGLFTSETPTSTNFTITFNQAVPAGDTVQVTVTSGNPGEGTVSDGVMSGTQAIYNVVGPQAAGYYTQITVTGVPDLVADGPQSYTISVATSCSTNATFNNVAIPPVNVTNNDINVPGITVSKTVGLITTEAGGTDSFSVTLATAPLQSPVTVTLSSSNTAEVLVSPSFLTFTAANYNSQPVVTVTGVDDTLLDFSQPFTIFITVSSAGTDYNGMAVPNPRGVNLDDEAIPPAKGAWGGGGCGLLGLEIGLPLLLLGLLRRRSR